MSASTHSDPRHEAAPPRGRLAPSPTGYLHVGNARSFLLAWLQMRAIGGGIILRIEDLDVARAVPGAAEEIVRDLAWLGLDWDNDLAPEYVQSARGATYRAAIERLRDDGHLFECYCSRRELRAFASAPHGAAGDFYPGRCRSLSEAEREERRADKEPALRFIVEPGTVVTFDDLVAGPQRDDVSRSTGDFIIARADGVPGYQLAVVLDDIAMGITHVLRGDDLLPSTPRQILLHRAFGARPPQWAHVPLILDADGARLAKRHAGLALADLRARGVMPERLVGWLAASAGLVPAGTACSASDLVADFDVAAIAHAPTVIDGDPFGTGNG